METFSLFRLYLKYFMVSRQSAVTECLMGIKRVGEQDLGKEQRKLLARHVSTNRDIDFCPDNRSEPSRLPSDKCEMHTLTQLSNLLLHFAPH